MPFRMQAEMVKPSLEGVHLNSTKDTANARFGSKRVGVIFEKPIGRSCRETLYFKALEIFGWRFRLPGLRSLRNPFSLTLDMLLNRLLQRDIAKALVYDELWLKEKFKVEPSWTFIHIGANIGQWSLYMANKVNKVIALEPVKEPFMWRRRNTEKFGNVLCLNFACWDADQPVVMFVRPNWGFGRYESNPNYTYRA